MATSATPPPDGYDRVRHPFNSDDPTAVDHRLQTIDRYVLLRLLGVGGMGQVHLAHDPQLRRPVAIKIPLGHFDDANRIRQRFSREGQAAAGISHPNVVPVLDTIDYEDRIAIVSRYVRGPTLLEYLVDAGGKIDPRIAAAIAMRLADGLAAVHRSGVIHRDLKPSNILLEVLGGRWKPDDPDGPDPPGDRGRELTAIVDASVWDGRLRICPQVSDFGLAEFLDDDSHLTRSGMPVGTAAYMAPEQIGEGNVTAATDVYSLGVIVYQMVTGVSPFAASTFVKTMARVRDTDPPAARLAGAVPPDLAAIIRKAMARAPADRFAEMEDFRDELDRWLGGLPVRTRPIGRVRRVVRWTRRNPVATAAMLLIGSLLAVSTVQRIEVTASLRQTQTARAAADRAREVAETARGSAEAARSAAETARREPPGRPINWLTSCTCRT